MILYQYIILDISHISFHLYLINVSISTFIYHNIIKISSYYSDYNNKLI